jgi:tetratricopeptide (TPR) repeat protein
MPGCAKLLLESAAAYADNNLVTERSVETAVEQSYGVKVKVADDAEDRTKLLNLKQLIHERMIDQEEAVSAVSNALRRAGAGVKNQGRPIGTFLFLGPTGVSKTELAKSLSHVYFNGEDNIIAPAMLSALGDCYVELETPDYAAAAKAFEKAASLANNAQFSPLYLFKAGLAYEAKSDNAKALKAYETIKTKWADSELANTIDKYIVRVK